MKKIILLLVSLIFTIICFSQKNEAYFQKIVDTTTSKELKLVALDSLIRDRNNQKDYNKFANRSEQYVNLAIEMKKYDMAGEFAIRGFSKINLVLGDSERALKLLDKAIQHSDKIKRSKVIAGLYVKKGGGLFNGDDYKEAIKNYTLAINAYQQQDSIHKADAIFFRGQAYSSSGNHKKAIDDYNLASIYYKTLGDLEYSFYVKGNIISVYGNIGFVDKAIEESNKLIQQKLDIDYINGIASDYYNIAGMYGKASDSIKQEKALLTALKYAKDTTYKYNNYTSFYTGLSNFYANKNLKKAKHYLDEASKTLEKKGKKNLDVYFFEYAKAKYLYAKGDYNTAINSSKKLLKHYKKTNNVNSIIKTNKLLSNIYKKKNNSTLALEYLQDYNKIKDSIYTIQKTNAIAYYQELYESEKKEKEINEQKASITSLAKENEAKQRLLLFGGIASLLAFFIFYLCRNRKRLQREKLLQEEFSQNLIEAQEQERIRVARELHDGVSQQLMMITRKSKSIGDQVLEALTNSTLENLRTISHNLHPSVLKQLGFTNAIKELITYLNQEGTILFSHNFDKVDALLSEEQSLHLYRIVQESSQNILKHSKATEAKIILKVDGNTIELKIKDNGKGFDQTNINKKSKSLGIRSIKERCNIIIAKLSVISEINKGTEIKLRFPIKS